MSYDIPLYQGKRNGAQSTRGMEIGDISIISALYALPYVLKKNPILRVNSFIRAEQTSFFVQSQ